MAHVDYPHEPGLLYNCSACESECFCDENLFCVFCADLEVEESILLEAMDRNDA